MPTEIAPLLRTLPDTIKPFTPESLAEFFAIPVRHFRQRTPKSPIEFHQAGLIDSIAYALQGTLFWSSDSRIIRGIPRVLATSDYVSNQLAIETEAAMFEALTLHEGAIEVMEPGVTMRLYDRSGSLHFATDAAFDGGNPVTGAGIENARALGIDYASQAMRLLEGSYRKSAALARLGYVLVFSLLLPERESIVPIDRPDLVLTDVIDPDHFFVDRLEKERIAEDYGLAVSTLHGRLLSAATPSEFYSRLRGLEHIAARDDVAGYVVKVPWNHDQLTVKVEPPSVRQAWTIVDEADIRAVYDAIRTDFGAQAAPPGGSIETAALLAPLDDLGFLSETMLTYLADYSRSVRWQVLQWLRTQIPARSTFPIRGHLPPEAGG